MKYVTLILLLLSFTVACSPTTPNPKTAPADVAPPEADSQIMCPQDAQQCPDGSWVGRSGSKCEFTCPGQSSANQ